MNKDRIRKLLKLPLGELTRLADNARREGAGNGIDLCNILNAKSGACAEDCKFCAQSARHSTDAARYSLKSNGEILKAAGQAKAMGADRFDIVTSGNTLTRREIERIADCISEIKKKVGIKTCASLGKLDEESLILLKKAGLTRYHHNIESSPGYFRRIVTTHSFEDRLKTIMAAKKAGLEVCSGGIIGMGETWDDRIEMALTLKKLGVDSVPINILVPIEGTRMAKTKKISAIDAIRTIALFRIILKDKTIKVAAGRESALKDYQALAFMAGANGMLIGGYLTVKGRSVDEDKKLIKEIKAAWKR
ncbi:MAG: biotin synthase BioB [Candidatus Omnitrophota bacterium]|nr:biotin synthase BioB [Candidatus Omnitrophota bacterium]